MDHRTFVIGIAFVLLFVAPASEAADHQPIYEFGSLYSSEHRLLPDIPKTEATTEERREYSRIPTQPDIRRSPDRSRWQGRLPWWREEAIERGPLPPFGQESTFERSLESGRAYYEGSRHAQGVGGVDTARDAPYGSGVARSAGTVKTSPEIAAVFWRQGRGQKVQAGPQPDHPALPNPGPIEKYKGVTLIGSGHPGATNEVFFETVKKAIDMAVNLSASLRALLKRIETVAYDPPSAERLVTGPILDIDAVYVIADPRRKAPVIFYRNMEDNAPQRVVLSLVGGGVMAARHERLIALLQDQGAAASEIRERDERLATIANTPQALVNEAECELQTILYRAEKALGVRLSKLRARLHILRQRKCR